MITLTPAYGRDYKTKKAATTDYLAGEDFILNDSQSRWNGKPCGKADFVGQEVILRYNRLTRVCTVTNNQ